MFRQGVPSIGVSPWKILIADDDADVHEATRLALRGTRFHDRPIEFFDAYSGVEVIEALRQHPDIAVIFLDVIMETDDAGLGAARRIRECGFNLVRIIVRTGFPGKAPVREVVVHYDIHAYKEKADLSAQELFTLTISALRAYADLVVLENHRRNLMSVLESVSLFDFNAINRYIAGLLAEFTNLTGLMYERLVIVSRPVDLSAAPPRVVATLGDWRINSGAFQVEDFPSHVSEMLLDSLRQGVALESGNGRTLFSRNHGVDLVIFAEGKNALSGTDDVLLDVFMSKVCQALSNHATFSSMLEERNAVLKGWAAQAERWDSDAATNLERMAKLVVETASRLETTLAFSDEINEKFLRDIGIASVLHDLGNQGMPPGLLAKPAVFSEIERRAMQTHVEKGLVLLNDFLGGAKTTCVMAMAQQIIAGHHEHFDGSGYPSGLRGDAIPLSARVVAVVDSYTALTADRPHRRALSSAEACTLIEAGSGSLFDSRIVQAFLTVAGKN